MTQHDSSRSSLRSTVDRPPQARTQPQPVVQRQPIGAPVVQWLDGEGEQWIRYEAAHAHRAIEPAKRTSAIVVDEASNGQTIPRGGAVRDAGVSESPIAAGGSGPRGALSESSSWTTADAAANCCWTIDSLALPTSDHSGDGKRRSLAMPAPTNSAVGPMVEGRIDHRHEFPLARATPQPAWEPAWEVDVWNYPPRVQALATTLGGAFVALGQQLAEASREGLRVLAITSPQRGQGRTTLSLLMARAAATAGLRVAVVDGDLAAPNLGRCLDLDVARGWPDALRQRGSIDDVAVNSLRERITILPIAQGTTPQAQAPATIEVLAMLDRLAIHHDLVIIDAGPLLDIGATLIGAGPVCRVDAAMVIRDRRQPQSGREVHGCAERLRRLGIDHVGAIEIESIRQV